MHDLAKIADKGGKDGEGAERFTKQYAQAIIESFKHAFADRARWLGDGADRADVEGRLLAPGYLDALAKKALGNHKAGGGAAYGSGWTTDDNGNVIPDDHGTSHLSVVDANGSAVACTETINLEFGSLLPVSKYGFVLNDQMDDFTTRGGKANAFGLRQSEQNRPGPGKRPLSSMSPTIVVDSEGKVIAVAGASGGPRIITGTTLVLLNALVLGMPADQAVAMPRLHHQWEPNVLRIDDRWDEIITDRLSMTVWLKKFGHQTGPLTSESAVQVIVREGEGEKAVWHAASDPRKGGRPAGE